MFSEFEFQTVRSANEPERSPAADESVANMQRPPVVQARVTAVINPTPPLTATVLGPVVQSGMPYRPRPRDVLATPARTLILDNHVIGSSPGAPALPPLPVRREGPDIREDGDAWFSYWDKDRNGFLTVDEVKVACRATFADIHRGDPRRMADIDEAVQMTWICFDTREDGKISRKEFLERNSGLRDTLLASLRR